MRTDIATLAFASVLSAQALGQIAAGPILDPATGTRYYRLAPTTWAGARSQAASMRGELATIQSGGTNEWIRVNVAAAGGNAAACFIGINDTAVEGAFTWLSGEPVVYTNWAAGEPNNQGNEDFGTMSPANGQWNDIPVGFNCPAIVAVSGPIRVPAEYPTIQAAIDAAVDGQVIEVAPGTYTGHVDFQYKKVIVRSEQGPAVTTIQTVDPTYGLVMAGGQGPETVLEGFTIRPANPTQFLVLLGDRQTVRSCRLEGAMVGDVLMWGSGVLSDCVMTRANIGVAIVTFGAAPTIQNCTIAGNQTGIFIQNQAHFVTVATVVNSIVHGNFGQQLFVQDLCLAKVSSSCVQGGYPGQGNISAAPQFTSAPGPNGLYELTDDFTPAAGSPCLDAGSADRRVAGVGAGFPRDAAWQNRFVDDAAADLASPAVDIGAIERQHAAPNSCPADFNADGFLDFFDLDEYIAAFEQGC